MARFKKGNIPWNRGKEMNFMKGELNPSKRLDIRKKISENKKLAWKNPNSLYRTKVENILKYIAINKPPMKGRKRPEHSLRMIGNNNPAWQGGKRQYYQHIARNLMKSLGFDINGKIVHHIDKNYKNNSIKNLKIFSSHSEHTKFHWKQGDIRKNG